MRRSRVLQSFLVALLALPVLAAAGPMYMALVPALDAPYPAGAFLYGSGQMRLAGGGLPQWRRLAGGHVFLYGNGGLTDLDMLADPAAGWTVADTAAIEDTQGIAARACRGGVCQAVTPDLVSAVPEPPVAALLAAGLALGLASGRRFRRPVRRRRG